MAAAATADGLFCSGFFNLALVIQVRKLATMIFDFIL